MKWESFESHLQSTHYDLYLTKQFADVTLVSDDLVTFPAHKTVLSTSSKIFKSLLAISTNDQHPFLYLKDVMKEELEGILQYIYLGEANISEHRAYNFEMVMRYFGLYEKSDPISKTSLAKFKSEAMMVDKLDFLYQSEMEKKSLFNDEKPKLNFFNDPADQMKEEYTFEPTIQNNDTIYEESEKFDNDVNYQDDIDEENEKVTYDDDKIEGSEKSVSLVQNFVETEMVDKLKFPKKKSNQYRKKEEEPTECGMCNIKYTTKRSYQRHYKSVHELDRADCDECGKQFSTKDMVTRHKKAVHMKLRYQCKKCEKNFSDGQTLRKHNMKLHTSCESCKVSFADQFELNIHIQQEHINKYCN